jgi:hypothetical protein
MFDVYLASRREKSECGVGQQEGRTTMANNQEISGMLIAESEDGKYEPLANVSSLDEARWFAKEDLAARMREVEKGGAPMCPAVYRLWARGAGGAYVTTHEFDATAL